MWVQISQSWLICAGLVDKLVLNYRVPALPQPLINLSTRVYSTNKFWLYYCSYMRWMVKHLRARVNRPEKGRFMWHKHYTCSNQMHLSNRISFFWTRHHAKPNGSWLYQAECISLLDIFGLTDCQSRPEIFFRRIVARLDSRSSIFIFIKYKSVCLSRELNSQGYIENY